MKFTKQKKLYVPALVILAAVFGMLIFIAMSTFHNFNRQKRTSQNLVHHQGIALLQAIEAGTLSAMAVPGQDRDKLGDLIADLGVNDNIAYIYVIDTDGTISHGSADDHPASADQWQLPEYRDEETAARMIRLPDRTQVYELSKIMNAAGTASGERRSIKANQGKPALAGHHQGSRLVLGMHMHVFEEAHRADIHHAIIMMVIVAALGASAIYFIYVINNYYRMNRTLRQTQAYARQVVASLASGLVSIAPDGQVVSYNQPALDVLGVSAEEFGNTPLNRFLDFDDTGIADTLAHGRPTLEKEIRYAAGSEKEMPIAVSVTPIRMEEDISQGAVIVLRDLSEIKSLEAQMRQAEKLAAVGTMAASMAHEIRNPLSSIKGFAKYLHNTIRTQGGESEYANVIVHEVDRINAVVNDLLTLARPESLDAATVDAAALINHAILLIKPDTDANGIDVVREFPASALSLNVDTNQMTQALLNLLINAVHAIGHNGCISVGIEARKKPNYDCIWIMDDGPGITADDCARLFDPFFTTRSSGTGLGLAIVHRIVENHHGTICVESPPKGKTGGSRFLIYLPIDKGLSKPGATEKCD